jgi:aryl-alcohol dehydrogenase-like predicted oxidoreductase
MRDRVVIATKFGDNDFRKNLPRFTPEAMAKNQALVNLLKRISSSSWR